MEQQYPTAVTFTAGCVVEADYVYTSTYLDAHDPANTIFTRLFSYVGRFEGENWFYHDADMNVAAVCVKKATPTLGRRLVALSKEGEVEIYSNKDDSASFEKIAQAGVRLGTRGYLTAIREIGGALFACGVNDQVYRRHEDGSWTLLTSAPLQLRSGLDPDVGMLNSIDGSSETDLYTCGLHGKLYHHDGQVWRQIALQTDEHLNCVRCISADEVWVCGNNGTLLTGNARDGFRDVSSIDDNFIFWSLAKFRNTIFLTTSDQGLFAYDGVAIHKVDTGFDSDLWTYQLDASEDMLWSFGPKEIARFDGQHWFRVEHPDNAPVE